MEVVINSCSKRCNLFILFIINESFIIDKQLCNNTIDSVVFMANKCCIRRTVEHTNFAFFRLKRTSLSTWISQFRLRIFSIELWIVSLRRRFQPNMILPSTNKGYYALLGDWLVPLAFNYRRVLSTSHFVVEYKTQEFTFYFLLVDILHTANNGTMNQNT